MSDARVNAVQQPADGGLGPGDQSAPAPAGFMLLGDDSAPGCVGDACAIPTPATPEG